MPDLRRATCRRCGASRDQVGPLSWKGFCGTCGPLTRDEANDDLHFHRGPTFTTWRRGMAASVGAVLLDDVKISE